MTRRQRRMLALGVGAVGVITIAVLLANVFQQNLMYFYSASEVASGSAPSGARIRLGGLVVPGSVVRTQGSLDVKFRLADCETDVPVRYSGILPDLFREGQGIVTTGHYADGVFAAEEVLAKHDETYMPPELAEKLGGETGHSCAPFKSLQTS